MNKKRKTGFLLGSSLIGMGIVGGMVTDVYADTDYTEILQQAETAVTQAETSKKITDISTARGILNQIPDSVTEKQALVTRLDAIQIPNTGGTTGSVSGDMDIVVTSDATLEMTLTTNLIAIDNYSGLEDVELTNALSIKVSSGLPFDLTVKAKDDLKSLNGNVIPIDYLSLKVNGGSYVPLSKDSSIVLVSNNEKGNDVQFTIDLKLKGDASITPDVYKSVLKFETVQK